MIPVAGQRVGPYEILGRLGSGGMGLVFSAWDARLHRDVAIKLLREEFIRGDSRERFMMEARAASGLNHPNICTIFDIGEQEGNPYLVMELLKGETLRARISAGALPPEQILSAGMEIADALAAAHGRGIIHRDIKPANIFMVARPGGGWQSKVLDFGLAKIDAGDGLDPRYQMTGAGSTVGTVAYMSPEQARGEVLDARSDLFALGIVLYEMATRHVPFDGLTSALIFVKLLGQAPEPVRQVIPGFPRALERVILKLLAKDRGSRFQSARDLCDALRAIELKTSAPNSRSTWLSKTLRSAVSKAPAPPAPAAAAEAMLPLPPPMEQPVVIHPIRRLPLTPPAHMESTRRESQASSTPAATCSDPAALPASGPAHSSVEESSRRSRAPAGRPASFGFAMAAQVDAPASHPVLAAKAKDASAATARRWPWVLSALAAALIVAGFIYFGSRPQQAVVAAPQSLLLAYVVNHSGDTAFDNVILEALRLDLEQSAHLVIPDHATTAAAAQTAGIGPAAPWTIEDARKAAKTVRTGSFLLGEISRGTGTFSIEATLYNTGSGNPVFHAEEIAAGSEQIAAAIDRLSLRIRTAMGEPEQAATGDTISLARNATAKTEALESYTSGLAAETAGHPLEAMAAFQRAVAIDPRFTQAWFRLAAIYASEHAEVAAAAAATHAREAAAGSSQRNRMLADAVFNLYATADYVQALRGLDQAAAAFPPGSSVGSQRALALRLQGRFQEALEAAQATLTRNPFDGEASRQTVYALLALDRGDAARKLEDEAEQHGQHHPDLRVLLSYVADPSAAVQEAEADQLRAQAYRAQLLDATGQMTAGLNAWRAAAATAQANPALASASAYMLAQAALDRALAGNCAAAAPLATGANALQRGPDAIFAAGMANALCDDLSGERNAVLALMAEHPQSFAVKGYLLGNLNTIDQIRSGDIDAAMATLEPLKPTDALSMSTYLSALAHTASKQWQTAADDYQNVLQRRGSTLLTNPSMYALAQLGLARARAAGTNPQSAAPAYAAFLQTWKSADPSNALLIEARKHAP